MPEDKRKVYCGYSHLITSLGEGVDANFEAIKNYKTNLSSYKEGISVCKIDRDALGLEGLHAYTFIEQLSISCIEKVIAKSKVALSEKKSLLIVATTKADISYLDEDIAKVKLWALSNCLEDYFSCANKPLILSNACVSSLGALLLGARFIENGTYDNVYVLGVDAISEFIVEGFASFKSLSASICAPYDKNRDGLTLGEACGVMLLSSDRDLSEHKVLLANGAMSSDANHISAPSRTGDSLSNAIDISLEDFNLSKQNGFINMHGTATAYNDEMESKAVNLSGLNDIALNSLKPYLGHTLGASGVVESILAVEQIAKGIVFGVKTHRENGVPYALNISNIHRESKLDYCIKTSSGFGGTNAVALFLREELATVKSRQKKIFELKEKACVSYEKTPAELLPDFIKDKVANFGMKSIRFMKMDNLSKLACVACRELLEGVELDSTKTALIMANSSSSLQSDMRHQAIINQKLKEGASPAVFVYTLANIAAAELAIEHKIKGELNFFIFEKKNLDFLRDYATFLIENEYCDKVVYAWCELSDKSFEAEFKLLTN